MLHKGTEVFVYWNLHKKLFSVRDVKSGLVVAHKDTVVLDNVTFKVSEAGRQRVLREQRKNVHAGLQGVYAGDTSDEAPKYYDGVAKYNPYKYDSFVDHMHNFKLKKAKSVMMFTREATPAIYYQGGK